MLISDNSKKETGRYADSTLTHFAGDQTVSEIYSERQWLPAQQRSQGLTCEMLLALFTSHAFPSGMHFWPGIRKIKLF